MIKFSTCDCMFCVMLFEVLFASLFVGGFGLFVKFMCCWGFVLMFWVVTMDWVGVELFWVLRGSCERGGMRSLGGCVKVCGCVLGCAVWGVVRICMSGVCVEYCVCGVTVLFML